MLELSQKLESLVLIVMWGRQEKARREAEAKV